MGACAGAAGTAGFRFGTGVDAATDRCPDTDKGDRYDLGD